MAGADEEDVACLRSDTLTRAPPPRGPRGHTCIARLDPADAAHCAARRAGQPRPTSPSLEDVDRSRPSHRVRLMDLAGLAVEEAAVERDVAEARRCDCDRRCGSRSRCSPSRNCTGPGPDVDVRQHRHVVVRGRWARRSAPRSASGWLSVTVTPLRTSRAAAADPGGGQVGSSAPRRPPSSHRLPCSRPHRRARGTRVRSSPRRTWRRAAPADSCPSECEIQAVPPLLGAFPDFSVEFHEVHDMGGEPRRGRCFWWAHFDTGATPSKPWGCRSRRCRGTTVENICCGMLCSAV